MSQGVSEMIPSGFIPQVVCFLTVFCFVTSRIREHMSIINRNSQDAFPRVGGMQDYCPRVGPTSLSPGGS